MKKKQGQGTRCTPSRPPRARAGTPEWQAQLRALGERGVGNQGGEVMRVLSGRQPWWWAILHADKRIENRKWNTHYRGPILLHAALAEYKDGARWIKEHLGIDCPDFADLPKGGIVGRARIVDVIPAGGIPEAFWPGWWKSIDMRWHMRDQFGFVLADVEPLPFFPCKGALSLFRPTPEMLAYAGSSRQMSTVRP